MHKVCGNETMYNLFKSIFQAQVKPSNNVLYIPDPNLRCSMGVNIGSSIFYTRATITIPEFHLISPAKEHYELLGEERLGCVTLYIDKWACVST